MKIMTDHQFVWFVTFMILALACGWLVVDALRLRKALREDRSDPEVRDRIFGCFIGLTIASLGIGGVIHFHLNY